MNKNKLRQDIIDELDPNRASMPRTNIGVAVENGIVALTGHVATYFQKTRIEDVVRRVKGVKDIEVRPFGANETADDEIAKRALNMIKWNTAVPVDVVQVKVQNGWVTLTGVVEWQYQKNAASDAIKGLAGVFGVRNNLDVRPQASASDVKKRIEDALKRNAEVEATAIKVTVLDGKVTLEGRVNLWSERSAAEHAAWSAPGVNLVVDRITPA